MFGPARQSAMLRRCVIVATVGLRVIFAQRDVQEVRFSLSDDGMSGLVHFKHAGEMHEIALSSHNVFDEDGEIYEHGEHGTARVEIPASRLYSGQRSGKRGLVKLRADGSVHHGLFEVNGSILHAQPLDGSAHHVVRPLEPLSLLQSEKLRGVPVRKLGTEPSLGDDSDGADFLPAVDVPSDELPNTDNRAMEHWGGVKWYPGCYHGDEDMHKFKLGVIIDEKGWSKHKGDDMEVKEHIQTVVAQASFIYEQQMNVRLYLDKLIVHKTTTNAPDYAVACQTSHLLETKLEQLKKGTPRLKKLGAWHMFTGCGLDHGTVGLAYIGTICSSGYNTGVSQIFDNDHNGTFLTFAHELGHNFGADHSFEEGQGKTGGIMDYGDGHLHGVYQFNTKYRKEEVCKVLSRKVNACKGNFKTLNDPRPGDPTTAGICKTTGSRGVGNDAECVFPFKYKPKIGNDIITYEGCTQEDTSFAGGIWCATEVDDDGVMVDDKWGECTWTPQCMGKDAACTTVGDNGGEEGRECIFPFNFGVGAITKEFHTCTYARQDVSNAGTLWCATKVDHDGNMEEWGDCANTDYCTNQWKTVGWAGVPPIIATEYGNQAWNYLNDLKDNAQESVANAGSSLWDKTFGRLIRWFKCLFGCEEEDADSSGSNADETRLYELHGKTMLTTPERARALVVSGCALLLVGMAIAVRRRRGDRFVSSSTAHADDGEAVGLVGMVNA